MEMGGGLLLEKGVLPQPESVQRQVGQSDEGFQENQRIRAERGKEFVLENGEKREERQQFAFKHAAADIRSARRGGGEERPTNRCGEIYRTIFALNGPSYASLSDDSSISGGSAIAHTRYLFLSFLLKKRIYNGSDLKRSVSVLFKM